MIKPECLILLIISFSLIFFGLQGDTCHEIHEKLNPEIYGMSGEVSNTEACICVFDILIYIIGCFGVLRVAYELKK